MHEIALFRQDQTGTIGGREFTHRAGTPVVGRSLRTIRIAWCELICDLASPKKRNQFLPGLGRNCGFNQTALAAIAGSWSEDLHRRWRQIDAMPDDGLGNKEIALYQLWLGDIEKIAGLITDLGQVPGGGARLCDGWAWSIAERRRWLLVVSDSLTGPEVDVIHDLLPIGEDRVARKIVEFDKDETFEPIRSRIIAGNRIDPDHVAKLGNKLVTPPEAI